VRGIKFERRAKISAYGKGKAQGGLSRREGGTEAARIKACRCHASLRILRVKGAELRQQGKGKAMILIAGGG
jgi:hypothetical protein